MKKLLFSSGVLVVALISFAFTTTTNTPTTSETTVQTCEHHDHFVADVNDDAVGGCIYCGGSAVGTTCSKAPGGKCVIHKPGRCSYCGGSSVGTSCSKAPNGYCAIPKDGKCTFCGGSAIGTSCRKSPTGKCNKEMPK